MTTAKLTLTLDGDLYTKYAETWPPAFGQTCDAAAYSKTGQRHFLASWTSDEELERAIKWMRDRHEKTPKEE